MTECELLWPSTPEHPARQHRTKHLCTVLVRVDNVCDNRACATSRAGVHWPLPAHCRRLSAGTVLPCPGHAHSHLQGGLVSAKHWRVHACRRGCRAIRTLSWNPSPALYTVCSFAKIPTVQHAVLPGMCIRRRHADSADQPCLLVTVTSPSGQPPCCAAASNTGWTHAA